MLTKSRNKGGEYASFMKEIVEKAESRNFVPSTLWITAIVPEEFAIKSRLIRENLCQFADLKIQFHIDLVPL
ncbi:scarecrow-like protein 15 [Cucumis melo var. makuwa]|uniref:Scarecrow-like protein 15 n=1 Tax=Cucumis melo var. makuwa TaxID=1194695 RepID=A0A5A7T2V1_CUCMM|nr:scarecrow-like protein 15 [Cucumis melo var. makuwa]